MKTGIDPVTEAAAAMRAEAIASLIPPSLPNRHPRFGCGGRLRLGARKGSGDLPPPVDGRHWVRLAPDLDDVADRLGTDHRWTRRSRGLPGFGASPEHWG